MPKLILTADNVPVPLSVPNAKKSLFIKNYLAATCDSGRLFMFAGDQKVEHLNKDFYGPGISANDASPEHLFEIASKGRIGVFATNLGLLARYGANYKNVRYVVKLNGKTNLVPHTVADPVSYSWTSVEHIVRFKERTGIDIVGIGMTVYLGSEFEASMLAQASHIIEQAHEHGLLTTLWMYPRGKSVNHERTPDIIAGAAGVAVCLGADFVKVNPPEAKDNYESAKLLQQATLAAGNTGVICSGGQRRNEKELLHDVYHQIHTGNAVGAAIGRNIHQKSLHDAIKLTHALAALIIDDVDVEHALAHLI